MRRLGGALVAVVVWLSAHGAALAAESGSRYSAPVWVWAAAGGATVGLGIAGFLIGLWFHRKRERLERDRPV